MSGPESTAAERKPRSNAWQTALTTVQEVEPPFIPAGAHAMTVVIEYPPGDPGAPPHRHPGPAFGYVLEGEYEWAIDDQPAKVLKAGETFYEPAGCLHRVSKNPGKARTRVLAWVIHPRDARDLVLPADKK